MKKNKPNTFYKLSDIFPTATDCAAKKQLKVLKNLISESSQVEKNIEKIITDLRTTSLPLFVPDLAQNQEVLRQIFHDCADVKFRSFRAGDRSAILVFLYGMTDRTLLEKNVLETLMADDSSSSQNIQIESVENLLTSASLSTVTKVTEAVDSVLTGNALLLIDKIPQAFIIGTKEHVKRGVEEAKTEVIVQGSHDAFNETLTDAIVLIRRRVRDSHLKVRILNAGLKSKTSIALLYVEHLVKPGLVSEIQRRLLNINTDVILVAYTIQELLGDHPWTPFPLAQRTERPDVVVAGLYEGRVGLLIDNTPMALILPCTFNTLIQSVDDYSSAPIAASLIRLLRHVAALIALLMPALYIAIVSYHPGMLPTTLAISIAELRARTPFPAFLEVLMMLTVLEIFQEAILRIPNKIVTAASVLGGLVIGTTIVQAGISNALLVVVMAMTAIASFCENYNLSLALRVLRVPLIFLASTLGLYGIMLGMLAILIHMCSLESYGEAYFGSAFDITLLEDWKDSLIRLPAKFLGSRPKQYGAVDRSRQPNENE